MIKKCNVLFRNELVMVVEYDEKKIQFPTDKKTDDFVYVKFDKGDYSISNEELYNSEVKKVNEKTQRRKKKEIIKNKEVIKEENSEL